MAERIVLPSGRTTQDLTGMPFGKLTAIKLAGRYKGFLHWWCTCECGSRSTLVRASSLKNGHTVSCGCVNREKTATLAEKYLTKHGCCRVSAVTSEFRIWAQMRARCSNPSNKVYHRYGGRGIRVCDRWEDFSNFIADIGPRPSPAHTIDRIDNDGPYSPENCHWATRKEQARNTRRNHLVTFNGETKPIAAWAEMIGLDQDTLAMRLKRGWTVEKAMTTPQMVNGYR